MDIEEITNSIKTKLGDEESGKIADDLANLLISVILITDFLINSS